MGPSLLVALTIPGLAVLLVVLAVVERAASGLHRHSPLHGRRRHAVSAAGADILAATLDRGRRVDVDRRLAAELLREDGTDGAPPHGRVDLDAGVAYLVLPPR